MFCKNCGNEILDNRNFCGKCGAAVTQGSSEFQEKSEVHREKAINAKAKKSSKMKKEKKSWKTFLKVLLLVFLISAVAMLLLVFVKPYLLGRVNSSIEVFGEKEELHTESEEETETSNINMVKEEEISKDTKVKKEEENQETKKEKEIEEETNTEEPISEETLIEESEKIEDTDKNAGSIAVANGVTAPTSDFIFPYSSERLITDEEMELLFEVGGNIDDRKSISQKAINEILSRYGFVFKKSDESLDRNEAYMYFNEKEWYLKVKGECEYTDSYELITHMNAIEKANIFKICAWQNAYAVTDQELIDAGEKEF